jgi:hypothetical protein
VILPPLVFPALTVDIRLDLKGLPRTNALAVTNKKSFVTSTPGSNVIKLLFGAIDANEGVTSFKTLRSYADFCVDFAEKS